MSKILLFLSLTLSANGAFADPYKSLCSYDSFCGHLKNSDGSFKAPKPEVIALLREMKPIIDESAKLYDVDPRAIAGAILAENSLNVQVADSVQDFLVKYKIAKTGKIFGKSFSFGLGQIHPETALEVESIAARIEGRNLRNEGEISQELLKPESAIKYVAAILKNTQDVYKKHGMDIKNDPALLTTLYNLGRPEVRAKETRRLGGNPKPNYFGYFVNQNLSKIESKANIHASATVEPVTLVAIAAPPASVVPQKEKAKTQEKLPKTQPPQITKSAENIVKQIIAKGDLTLSRGPSRCLGDGSGNEGEEKRWKTYTAYGSVGIIKQGRAITVLSEGLGCGMEDWILVQSTDGETGWLKKEVYDAGVETRYENKPLCENKRSQCRSQLAKIKNYSPLSDEEATSSKSDLLHVAIVGKSDSSWKQPNNTCLTVEEGKELQKNSTGKKTIVASGYGLKQTIIESKDWAKDVLKEINDAKTQSLKILNEERKKHGFEPLSNWESEENPFYPIISASDKQVQKLLSGCATDEWLCSPPPPGSFDKIIEAYKKTISKDYSNNYLWSINNGVNWWINIPSVVYLGHARGTDLWKKEKEDALKELDKCQFVSDKSVSRSVLHEVRKYVEENGVTNIKYNYNPSAGLASPLMSLAIAGELCEKVISPNPNKTPVSKDVCDYAKNKNSNISFQISVLKMTLGNDLAVQDSLISNMYEWIEAVRNKLDMGKLMEMYTMNQSQAMNGCGYNQFKTAKLIEELLKNKCVKNVYIEDPWMLNYFGEKSKKVIYQAFSSENRFAVEFDDGACN